MFHQKKKKNFEAREHGFAAVGVVWTASSPETDLRST